MTASACSKETFVQTVATVTQHEPASARYYRLRLRCPEIARRALPGQFVMLACAPDIGGRSEPLLPRPLAILDAHGDELELLYFVAGFGTDVLRATAEASVRQSTGGRDARDTPPKTLRIIGPLGRGFEPIPHVDTHVALGGGSGVAPLVFFFRRAAANSSAHWHLILGARNAAQLVRDEVVRAPGTLHRATDDGTAGFRGNAVQLAESLLAGELKGRAVGLYAAGPEPMMEAAAKIGARLGLPVRVSLEARMGCGVGVCRACVVDGVAPHPKTGLLRRTVCQDGPVFDTKELAGWAGQ